MNTEMEQQNTHMTPAPLPQVQEVLRAAGQELTGLLQQRVDIMKRIGTIKQVLSGIADLCGDSILNDELRFALDGRVSNRPKGFTRACRRILMDARTPLPIRQSCDELRRRFPELAARHRDLAASVTTVFHRLVAYGEARFYLDEKGTRVWQWIAEPKAHIHENCLVDFEVTIQPQPTQSG